MTRSCQAIDRKIKKMKNPLLKHIPKALFCSALASAFVPACSAAEPDPVEAGSHQIEVIFTNVKSANGMIWASLCTKEQYAKLGEEPCEMNARIDAEDRAVLTFSNVPSGTYAISAFHDDNANQRLDFDTRGIPYEPTGNSGNAKGFFGPPSFNQMKFRLREADQMEPKQIQIKMSTISIP